MIITEIIFIGMGLAMDAAAVSMTNGMCDKKISFKNALKIALFFGIFQGLMPVIGYFAGSLFSEQISKIDHVIALVLLVLIGSKMLTESLKTDECDEPKQKVLTTKTLFVQSIATSIDALAVGVSFVALKYDIVLSASIIAIVTFIISFISVYLGKKFGEILNKKAEILGGIILIAIGLKIFISHIK